MSTPLDWTGPTSAWNDPRLDAAFVAFDRQIAAGNFDVAAWIAEQPADLEADLIDFLHGHEALAAAGAVPAVLPRDLSPTLPDFGRYANLKLIGFGGLGVVYAAYDRLLNRSVALKFLHTDRASRLVESARFLREARIVARLQHPNIVPVYDLGTAPGGRPFFSMRYIEARATGGRTLRQAIIAHHALPANEWAASLVNLLGVFVGACDAVAFAHSVGLTHRDLKPDNVLTPGPREALVIDWGLSDAVDSGEASGPMGTWEFMSPEVANGQPATTASDVFGLGGLLAAILTNRHVYVTTAEHSARELASAGALSGVRARLAASGAAPELIALAERCLDPDPTRRPTATETGAAVTEYVAQAAQRESVERERVRQERSKRKLQGMLALAALLLAASGLWYLNNRDVQERRELAERSERERAAEERGRRVESALAEGMPLLAAGRLDAADAAFQRARGALGVDPPSALVEAVARAERLRDVALQLERTRQELAVLRVDPLRSATATRDRYVALFGQLGIDLAAADAGARVAASPLRSLLVAALDDMAIGGQARPSRERLWEVARAADPDPAWGDRFRSIEARGDPVRLVATAPLERMTAGQMLALVNVSADSPDFPKLLRTAQSRYPSDFGLNLVAAMSRYESAQSGTRTALPEALAYARAAAAIQPESLAAQLLLALILERSNQPDDLDALAVRMVAAGGDSWMAYKTRAIAARKRGRFREAQQLYLQAAERDPDNDGLALDVAGCQMRLGDWRAAEDSLTAIINRRPDAYTARSMRAMLWVITGRLTDGEAECRAVRASHPNDPHARIAWAVLMFGRGRLADCERLLETIGAGPEPELELFSALCYLACGKIEKAGACVARVEQVEQSPVTHMVRFMTCIQAGQYAEALAALSEANASPEAGGSPLAGIMRVPAITLWSIRINVGHAVKWEKMIGDGLPAVNGKQLTQLSGFERWGLIHVAEVLLGKRLPVTAAFAYRELLSGKTVLGSAFLDRPSFCGGIMSYRINAARAAALTSAGAGRDADQATDAVRAEFRTLALTWLTQELETCRTFAARTGIAGSLASLWDDGSPRDANFRLHIMKAHPDLEGVRNPQLIARMPEADRLKAEALWRDIDTLYAQLNPPLDEPKP